jgi:ABC-type phosphate transport system substrate-binding protein
MSARYARRLLACMLPAAALAALAAPGAASAEELKLIQCEGGNIHGKGSSAQKLVQLNQWTKLFNTSANPTACQGTEEAGKKSSGKPVVTYTSTGSGVGMESWGVETKAGKAEEEIRFGPENAFVGTEIAPNKKQAEEITKHGAAGTVLTIPVAQAAIAVVIHLPAGCEKVKGGPEEGRLAFKDSTVEKLFQGTITTWKSLLNKAKLEGTAECSSSAKIVRVVREDGSGTTDAFMKWLGVIFKKEVLGTETWKQLGEKAANTVWPNEGTDPVKRGKGGGGVVKVVEENAGTVGYANVADARANAKFVPPAGGAGKATFWGVVESNLIEKIPQYRDPATNGDIAAKGSSNCAETLYTNGTKKFPPPSPHELWNEVVSAKKQVGKEHPSYEICTLTYDLALTKYEPFSIETVKEGAPFTELPTEAEARTVRDYLNYALSTGEGGGQPAAENEDYFGDPTAEEASQSVLAIARKGVKEIGFK